MTLDVQTSGVRQARATIRWTCLPRCARSSPPAALGPPRLLRAGLRGCYPFDRDPPVLPEKGLVMHTAEGGVVDFVPYAVSPVPSKCRSASGSYVTCLISLVFLSTRSSPSLPL